MVLSIAPLFNPDDQQHIGRMLVFRMLGGIGLSVDGQPDLDSLLRQPKHVALLAFLAIPKPGSWHRRDAIVGTFWPELEQSRARASLRSALYTLRRQLPTDVILSRGDDELSLNPGRIETDVDLLSQRSIDGRLPEAIALYTGEFLPGLFVSDAPAFDKWLDVERTRVRSVAIRACSQLADQREASGDLPGAIVVARRASELDPDDEAAVRRWITLLDRIGDRAQAFAVYDRFRNHLSEAFGIRPSAETVALLETVRTRREVNASVSPTISMIPALPTTAASVVVSPISAQASTDTATPASAAAVTIASDTSRTHAASRGRLALAASTAILLVLVAVSWSRGRLRTASSRSLVVLPMTNQTGDSALSYVTEGLASDVAHRLDGVGGITIRRGTRSPSTDSSAHDLRSFARAFGLNLLLRSSLHRAGDSLEVRMSVVDASTLSERDIASIRFTPANMLDAGSRLAARVAAAAFRMPQSVLPQPRTGAIDSASYRLTVQGYHTLLAGDPVGSARVTRNAVAARALFDRAVALDPQNARAWAGLSSVYSAMALSDQGSFDELYNKVMAAASNALAIDSLQGPALANLALMRALNDRDLTIGLRLMRQAELAEPSNPEVFLVKTALMRVAHRYDAALDAIRVSQQLEPLESHWVSREATTQFCAGRPERALPSLESEHTISPKSLAIQASLTRAYSLMNQYDRAVNSWKLEAQLSGDTALANLLSRTSADSTGYWSARHSFGQARLQASQLEAIRTSPLREMQLQFASGNFNAAYAAFDAALKVGTRGLYRLTCMPDVDEVRRSARFLDALNRAGELREH